MGVFVALVQSENGFREIVAPNLITDEGMSGMLSTFFSGTATSTPWYIGLMTNVVTVLASDTLASHPGWDDWTAAPRQVWLQTDNLFSVTLSTTPIEQRWAGLTGVTSVAISPTEVGTVGGFYLTDAATGNGNLFAAAQASVFGMEIGDKAVVTYLSGLVGRLTSSVDLL